MGVLASVDSDALAVYCQLYARWREAEEFLEENGSIYVVRTDSGQMKYAKQYPQVLIARSLAAHVRAYQKEFGMTPSARSGVETVAPGKSDFAKFLAEKHGPPSPRKR